MSNNDARETAENVITVGTYVIVKKQSYSKVYRVTENGTLTLGRDQVEMREIVGRPYWSTFEMVPSQDDRKKIFSLKWTQQTESWDDLKGESSGRDNRTITDDGTSQRLSKEEILRLQEAGKTGREIIGSLIENSRSFAVKTEYSQEKYIRKKERKYFRFLTVCKPTIVSLHETYYRFSHDKIAGLRMDTLAQMLSYGDVQADGLHVLYDSGSHGLAAAAVLNRIGTDTGGHLINLHPGNMPQTTMVQAMNFPQELRDRHVTANVYSFLRLHYQGESAVLDNIKRATGRIVKKSEDTGSQKSIEETDSKINDEEASKIDAVDSKSDNDTVNDRTIPVNDTEQRVNTLKRKLDESEDTIPEKKPKWLLETQRAVDLVDNSKARSLIVVTKEHPLNIVTALLPFLGASRPFVIFHAHREPLQETYMQLKQRHGVINLRLFANFLRSYQILPDRTHPDILTSDTGGYILTGYQVQ